MGLQETRILQQWIMANILHTSHTEVSHNNTDVGQMAFTRARTAINLGLWSKYWYTAMPQWIFSKHYVRNLKDGPYPAVLVIQVHMWLHQNLDILRHSYLMSPEMLPFCCPSNPYVHCIYSSGSWNKDLCLIHAGYGSNKTKMHAILHKSLYRCDGATLPWSL